MRGLLKLVQYCRFRIGLSLKMTTRQKLPHTCSFLGRKFDLSKNDDKRDQRGLKEPRMACRTAKIMTNKQSTPSDRVKIVHHTSNEDCGGKQNNNDGWRAAQKDVDDVAAITAIIESAKKGYQQPSRPLPPPTPPLPPLRRKECYGQGRMQDGTDTATATKVCNQMRWKKRCMTSRSRGPCEAPITTFSHP